jgi:hypothetical protein
VTVDLNQLWLLLVVAVITGGGAALMGTLSRIQRTLQKHGEKLVRIEFKLGIPDNNGSQ